MMCKDKEKLGDKQHFSQNPLLIQYKTGLLKRGDGSLAFYRWQSNGLPAPI